MNEWMNEWMNGWMNEWMNEWVSEWIKHKLNSLLNFFWYEYIRLQVQTFTSHAGGSVADLVHNTKETYPEQRPVIPEQLALKYLKDVLQALEFIHSKGLVHNDVKGRHDQISSRAPWCFMWYKKKTLRGADESTTLLLNSWINHLGSTCNKRWKKSLNYAHKSHVFYALLFLL